MNRLRYPNRGASGFTLIELIVLIVIIGLLGIIAIPKYLDLTQQAKASATQASLGAVRSVLYMKYAENVSSNNPSFPPSLAATDFTSGTLPTNECTGHNGIGVVATPPTGTATNNTNGFWYIVASGQAGAYSGGSSGPCGNTASW